MSQMKTRREIALLATGGVVAAGLIAAAAKPALAYQGSMNGARASLLEALRFLQIAESDKGGHRVVAIQLIQQAIGEVNAGIAYADQHGG